MYKLGHQNYKLKTIKFKKLLTDYVKCTLYIEHLCMSKPLIPALNMVYNGGPIMRYSLPGFFYTFQARVGRWCRSYETKCMVNVSACRYSWLCILSECWSLVCNHYLKVPRCEIFDLLDSCDLHTIKPLCVGNFGTVIKKFPFGHDLKVWRNIFV